MVQLLVNVGVFGDHILHTTSRSGPNQHPIVGHQFMTPWSLWVWSEGGGVVTLIRRGVVRQVCSQTHCLSFWQGFECAVDSDSTLCRQGEGIICLTLRGRGGRG